MPSSSATLCMNLSGICMRTPAPSPGVGLASRRRLGAPDWCNTSSPCETIECDFAAFYIDDEAYTTGVVFIARVIEALFFRGGQDANEV